MAKPGRCTARWLAIAHAMPLGTPHARCLDPATGKPAYRLPLGVEVRRAEAIAIGRVLAEQGLQEDPDDPDGCTAWNTGIEVLDNLKGRTPGRLAVRNGNTSSRHAMGVGERHLPFLAREGGALWGG